MAYNLFVTNISDDNIEVAINIWEKGNLQPDYFAIERGDGHTLGWNRSDSRGFIMAVKRNSKAVETYYVFGDRDYRIHNDGVYLNDKKLALLDTSLFKIADTDNSEQLTEA